LRTRGAASSSIGKWFFFFFIGGFSSVNSCMGFCEACSILDRMVGIVEVIVYGWLSNQEEVFPSKISNDGRGGILVNVVLDAVL
jgi:hypothetical protein